MCVSSTHSSRRTAKRERERGTHGDDVVVGERLLDELALAERGRALAPLRLHLVLVELLVARVGRVAVHALRRHGERPADLRPVALARRLLALLAARTRARTRSERGVGAEVELDPGIVALGLARVGLLGARTVRLGGRLCEARLVLAVPGLVELARQDGTAGGAVGRAVREVVDPTVTGPESLVVVAELSVGPAVEEEPAAAAG